MKSYWIWLGLLIGIWAAALLEIGLGRVEPYQWFGCAVFLGLYFAAPLARHRPAGLTR
ncbi:hypothetical protein [Paenibacillus sp. 1P07SE]|uniref:hypothetical protein n=1 Tax=Paenibacillus sp. 1P07SE TaxID=3132209 RepID=UPI0039A5E61A